MCGAGVDDAGGKRSLVGHGLSLDRIRTCQGKAHFYHDLIRFSLDEWPCISPVFRLSKESTAWPSRSRVHGRVHPARPEDDRRQLQDSPILGDVWIEYARRPTARIELLAHPYRERGGRRRQRAAGRCADLDREPGSPDQPRRTCPRRVFRASWRRSSPSRR
jgi:hypothetical protein